MLSLCATPIGNLGDLTPRVAEAFSASDCIYCEDTRRTLQLLNHLGLKKPLVSCHAHNEAARTEELIALLRAGKHICYASDAGMPGISDPGERLVRACIEHDLPFEVLPGASAVLTAAVLSGLPCGRFTFFGFLPRDNSARREMLSDLAACPHLMILYESPHRVVSTLRLLLDTLGDRPAALVRELTKKFEGAERGTLSALLARLTEPPKGECVLCVLGQRKEPAAPDGAALDAALTKSLAAGLSVRDAAAAAAERFGIPKKDAYRRALSIGEEG